MPPKRHWLRFSLRTLIVAMTLAGLGFSLIVRGVFLERRARFHESEYTRLIHPDVSARIKELEYHDAQWHKQAADTCRRAMFRPWTTASWADSPRAPE